jgi:pyrimidine oxygenase
MSRAAAQPAPAPIETFGLPSDKGLDLGIFMPMANGGWIISKNSPRLDGSYDYNLAVAKLAEELGFDFIGGRGQYRGFGGETAHWNSSLDSPMLMAALARATSRVKVWGTVHTLLQNPAVVAKMFATLDQISHGRAGLNVVTGSYRGEFDQMGAWRDDVDHDQRYVLATEWLQAVKALGAGRRDAAGTCSSLRLHVQSSPAPFLVCAGSSPPGIRFLAELDALFLSGTTPEELAAASRRAKAWPTNAADRSAPIA